MLGVLAAIVIAIVLSGNSSDEKVVPASRVAVIAARDIPANTRVTAAMLKTEVFDLKDVDAESFSAVSQVTNRVTSRDLKAGDVVVPAVVSETRGSGLTFTVKPGMRAASIGVKEVVTAGGNIVPGNYVDVIGFFSVPKGYDINNTINVFLNSRQLRPALASNDDNTTVTLTFLQNVRVLAVAQSLSNAGEPTDRTATAKSPGGPTEPAKTNPKAGTVTLEVTPEQAQILTLADESAGLRLLLRPFGETDTEFVNPIILVTK
jgi:pilus assembly protein CpaB